jgi:hypothetical protein
MVPSPDHVSDRRHGLHGFTIIFVIALWVGAARDVPGRQPGGTPSMPREEWWFWWYSSAIALMSPWLSPVFLVGFPVMLFAGMLLAALS